MQDIFKKLEQFVNKQLDNQFFNRYDKEKRGIMELNEYYVKQIFRSAGLPVLDGDIAYTPEEAQEIAQKLGGNAFWLKPQMMTPVPPYTMEELQDKFFASSPIEVGQKSALIMGESFNEPHPVFSSTIQRLYVEQAIRIDVFCRLVFRVDFERLGLTFSICQDDQEICTLPIDDMQLSKVFCQKVCRQLKITDLKIKKEFLSILDKSFKLFLKYGAMALELSPVVRQNKTLIVVDGRLIFDPNSLFRFPELEKCREIKMGHEREALAKKNAFRYTGLNGNIACLANGIGLGWATVDLVQENKGSVACLLDVGTNPTVKSITTALKLALAEPNVDAILVNIFGGITSCKVIAQGLLDAAGEISIGIPIVVRMVGLDADEGESMLRKSIVPFYCTKNMKHAVLEVIRQLKEEC